MKLSTHLLISGNDDTETVLQKKISSLCNNLDFQNVTTYYNRGFKSYLKARIYERVKMVAFFSKRLIINVLFLVALALFCSEWH